ncbi:hypothetical protein BJG92_02855 [Arthrobacter sp. SO5]|uniref:hypothetical protein n=1 Tax=Arthrobacter sp. SO5 TaxID=1897055 RepID=UPI001E3EC52E|nr:hypothetical protein [Arthrobacter sp. SO5]MCB5275307.1 hypothetical protein [Arthrobacter sp. SO5]
MHETPEPVERLHADAPAEGELEAAESTPRVHAQDPSEGPPIDDNDEEAASPAHPNVR